MKDAAAPQEISGNRFEDLRIDVPALYARFPIDAATPRSHRFPVAKDWLSKIYRSPLLPLGYRQRFWQLAHRTRLDIEWFEAFRRYWSEALGGRPLAGPDDFFFLKNWYRVKFQRSSVADSAGPQEHLAAWQSPELLYQLFHLAHKGAVSNETHLLRKLFRYCPNPRAILEFGCGTGPIAQSLFQFFRPAAELRYYLSDLQSLAFHYAAWQYRACSNIIPAPLLPENDFLFDLQVQFDAICCMTVFEHLPAPLKVIKHFHARLGPGGILIFDYIKGDGGGMDTIQAVRERKPVLEFIREHFELLEGNLSDDRSMGLTIVRRKSA